MAVAHEPWLLWFSCFLSGIGGTLFDPPRTALVVKLIRPQQRGRFFSILMMQDSAGAVIGALLGSWLLQYDFRLVCAAGAVLFILCALFNACSAGVETVDGKSAGARRAGPRAARQTFCHLC
jgi:DHA1 family multidrug resistance protein-like MFS transporter